MRGDRWLREGEVARMGMVLLRELHWSGVTVDIIWTLNA